MREDNNFVRIAISKNDVPIRLPMERWFHIVDNHDYMAGMSDYVLDTIENPERIIKGDKSELFAIKKINHKHLIVIYKEISKEDGFVITAFMASDIKRLLKRELIWKKQ